MFRGAELVKGREDRPLALRDVWFLDGEEPGHFVSLADRALPLGNLDNLVIRLDFSKTRQRGSAAAGVAEDHVLHAHTESGVCPVATLRSWWQCRVLTPGARYNKEAPLFITSKGETVTTAGLLKLLRKGLQELGLADAHLFGLHSERIGGTSARLAGGATQADATLGLLQLLVLHM